MLRLTDFGEKFTSIQEIFNEILKSNQEMKKIARTDREARLDSVEQSAMTAAAEMRAGAALSLVGTIVSSTTQIIGAGMSVTGAIKAQQKMDEVLGATDTAQKLVKPEITTELKTDTQLKPPQTLTDTQPKPPQTLTDTQPKPPQTLTDTQPKPPQQGETPTPNLLDPNRTARMEQAKIEANVISQQWQYKATSLSEGGKIAGGVFNIAGQWLEAARTEEQARGARQQALADTEGDFKQAAEKAIAAVLEKMSEIQRAQSQTITTIVRSA